ncbi:MAG: DUF1585 domain-containing protein, partial [Planctomycetaceae bacterium]|nr:DUF1585 domain-containing protein [Planctomycetaceae bacterium]
GRWRDRYSATRREGATPSIDPSGTFPSGERFQDFDSFKQVLVETRLDLFTRSLIEKLLAYSTGRHMTRSDRFEVEDILARVKNENYVLQSLAIEVLTSKTFRSR